jgi:hypothetical protein
LLVVLARCSIDDLIKLFSCSPPSAAARAPKLEPVATEELPGPAWHRISSPASCCLVDGTDQRL